MESTELAKFLAKEVSTFTDIKVLDSGNAFHYTTHFNSIQETGHFLGAPIDVNLDRTQITIPSKAATCDPGVVFAYEQLQDAVDEGFGCDIVKIKYKRAVRATHSQEAADGAPPTLLIINSDISDFMIEKAYK